jgi:hypothetical protein
MNKNTNEEENLRFISINLKNIPQFLHYEEGQISPNVNKFKINIEPNVNKFIINKEKDNKSKNNKRKYGQ